MLSSISRKYKLLALGAIILAFFAHKHIATSQDVERLVMQLEGAPLEQQIEAARGLGMMGSTASDALDSLDVAARDSSAELRAEAIRAMIFIDSREAIAILSDALNDRNLAVRIDAAEALEHLGSPRAAEVLASRRAVTEKRYERAALGDLVEKMNRKMKTEEKKKYKAHLRKYVH